MTENLPKCIAALALACLCPVLIMAQKAATDTLPDGQLPTVEIIQKTAHLAPAHLPELSIDALAAGRKNESVRPDMAGANAVSTAATRQIFARVPGLTVWESDQTGIQTNIAARGLSPNRSWEFNVRQNGYDVAPDPLGYPEAYFTPPVEAVREVRLVRGASSLQYGPQFGGLVDYVLKTGPPDRPIQFESSATAGSFGLRSSYHSVGGKLGQMRYFGFFHARNGEGWRANSRFSLSSGHFSLDWAATEKLSLGLEYSRQTYSMQQAGGLSDAQFEADPRQSARSRNWFGAPWNVGAATAKWFYAKNARLTARLFGLVAERNSVGFVRAITVADTFNLAKNAFNARQVDRDFYQNWGLEVRNVFEWAAFGKQHALVGGLRFFDGQTERRQLGEGSVGSDFDLELAKGDFARSLDFSSRNAAVFVENAFRLTKKLAIIPGVRFEKALQKGAGRIGYNADGSEKRIAPQSADRQFLLAGVSAEQHLFKNSEVYAGAWQSWRPVLFSDLTPAATTDEIDPNLKDASGWTSEIGWRGMAFDWLRWDVSGYSMRYENRIATLARLREDGSVYQFRTNVGASQTVGAELFLQADLLKIIAPSGRFGKLETFAAVGLTRAEYGDFRVVTAANGQLTETNLDGKRVEYAPRQTVRAGLSFSKKGFAANANWSSVGGVFADAANTEMASANGQTGWIDGYRVVDLSTTQRFLEGKMFIRAGATNLLDEQYATRRSGGYPGPGLLPGEGRAFFATVGATF